MLSVAFMITSARRRSWTSGQQDGKLHCRDKILTLVSHRPSVNGNEQSIYYLNSSAGKAKHLSYRNMSSLLRLSQPSSVPLLQQPAVKPEASACEKLYAHIASQAATKTSALLMKACSARSTHCSHPNKLACRAASSFQATLSYFS